jgi:hypothetical protein
MNRILGEGITSGATTRFGPDALTEFVEIAQLSRLDGDSIKLWA